MSGQLVGEVIAAAQQLRELGLSPNGFHALIAIAEKCHHVTRQAPVRREWIQAAIYGSSSSRSAERAVRELRDLKLIDVLKRGYKAPNQKAMASTYQLMELPPPRVADAESEAPAVQGWRELAAAKSVEAAAISGQAAATQGGGLDGCLDGYLDGVARVGAWAREAPIDSPDSRSGADAAPPKNQTQNQEQEHAPNGAGEEEKKPRPQIGGMVHRVLKSTNIDRAGHPPSRQLDDSVREERNRFLDRLAGVPDCDECDDDGYLPDDTQCWHGQQLA